MISQETLKKYPRVIIFDGICELCSAFMRFVYRFDKTGTINFAWIQSPQAQDLLAWADLPKEKYETIIYIENEIVYQKSTAFLKIIKYLRFPLPVLQLGWIVPLLIRDWFYDLIARNRYKWFGKKEACLVPTGELAKRFISD